VPALDLWAGWDQWNATNPAFTKPDDPEVGRREELPMRKILIALAGGALVVTMALPAGASTAEPQRGGSGAHFGSGRAGDHWGRGGDHWGRGGDHWGRGDRGDRDRWGDGDRGDRGDRHHRDGDHRGDRFGDCDGDGYYFGGYGDCGNYFNDEANCCR
jgi:hypothetical protein